MFGRGLYTGLFGMFLLTNLSAQVSFSTYLEGEIKRTQNLSTSVESEIIPFKAPVIRRWDFRMDTDEFKFDRQEYQIRGNVSSRAIRKYQNQMYEGYAEELNFERAKSYKVDAEEIYNRWLQSYFAAKEGALKKEMLPYLDDQILMLKKVDPNGELSLYDYLDKQKELDLLKWDISKKDKILEALKPELGQTIGVESIVSFVEAVNLKLNLSYPNYEADQLDIKRIETEYNLEEAEAAQILDFFRVSYNGPHTNLLEERLSVGVALNFRRSEKRELDLVELKFEKQMEEEQIAQRQYEYQLDVAKSLYEFRNAVDVYYSFQQVLQRLDEQYAIVESQNPVSKRDIIKWLDLKREYLASKEKLVQLEKDVFDAYLDWLDVTGILDQYYSINFLSPGLSADLFLDLISK